MAQLAKWLNPTGDLMGFKVMLENFMYNYNQHRSYSGLASFVRSVEFQLLGYARSPTGSSFHCSKWVAHFLIYFSHHP